MGNKITEKKITFNNEETSQKKKTQLWKRVVDNLDERAQEED